MTPVRERFDIGFCGEATLVAHQADRRHRLSLEVPYRQGLTVNRALPVLSAWVANSGQGTGCPSGGGQ